MAHAVHRVREFREWMSGGNLARQSQNLAFQVMRHSTGSTFLCLIPCCCCRLFIYFGFWSWFSVQYNSKKLLFSLGNIVHFCIKLFNKIEYLYDKMRKIYTKDKRTYPFFFFFFRASATQLKLMGLEQLCWNTSYWTQMEYLGSWSQHTGI